MRKIELFWRRPNLLGGKRGKERKKKDCSEEENQINGRENKLYNKEKEEVRGRLYTYDRTIVFCLFVCLMREEKTKKN
jgi:hypothetical protein